MGDKGWTHPDSLREFQEAGEWKGGMVLGMSNRARGRSKCDRLSSFGSIDAQRNHRHRHSTMERHMGRDTMPGSPGQYGHRGGCMQ